MKTNTANDVGLNLRTYKNTLSDGSETYDLEVKGSLRYLLGLDKVVRSKYKYAAVEWFDDAHSIYIESTDKAEAYLIEKDIKDYTIKFIEQNWGFDI